MYDNCGDYKVEIRYEIVQPLNLISFFRCFAIGFQEWKNLIAERPVEAVNILKNFNCYRLWI